MIEPLINPVEVIAWQNYSKLIENESLLTETNSSNSSFVIPYRLDFRLSKSTGFNFVAIVPAQCRTFAAFFKTLFQHGRNTHFYHDQAGCYRRW